ncbi:MAG: CocE/NonD family hydrolase [Gemmatimonadales bacterium]
MRRSLGGLAVALLLALLPLALFAQDKGADPSVDLVWGARIPLRDGVTLNATIYLPAESREPRPVIFTLTPYIADSYHDRAMYFARHGYVFALVDVRGRGNSGGAFEPMANEAKDGHDVVEWLAAQPWSNGKVTMWGGSYAGFDQWSTLKEFPPHLATIVPAAAAHPGIDFPFQGNVYSSYVVQWMTFTSGVTGNTNLFGEASYWRDKFGKLYDEGAAYATLDRLVGNPLPNFQKWIAHPVPDAYWDAMVPDSAAYARIGVPILTITGHYDGDQPGAMEYYHRHMRWGSADAKAKHFLILGPWDHAGTRTPRREVDGLSFGPASLVDLNALHKEWYDWTMSDGPKPGFLRDRVAYYVVGPGAEEWKYAPSLDAVTASRRTLYLSSDGEAGDAFASGALTGVKPTAERSAPSDRFVYDPRDLRPGRLEREPDPEPGLLSQRAALNLFGHGVVYHSAPFEEATEVTGYVRLVAYLSMDVPDTDLQATLYEILPNGTSVMLTGDILRARYRNSPRVESPVPAGTVERYELDGFPFFSRRVSRGSRLRLVIQAPNSIHLQKNYNAGGVVARETRKDARTAHITLHHDASYPSMLEIPIGR